MLGLNESAQSKQSQQKQQNQSQNKSSTQKQNLSTANASMNKSNEKQENLSAQRQKEVAQTQAKQQSQIKSPVKNVSQTLGGIDLNKQRILGNTIPGQNQAVIVINSDDEDQTVKKSEEGKVSPKKQLTDKKQSEMKQQSAKKRRSPSESASDGSFSSGSGSSSGSNSGSSSGSGSGDESGSSSSFSGSEDESVYSQSQKKQEWKAQQQKSEQNKELLEKKRKLLELKQKLLASNNKAMNAQQKMDYLKQLAEKRIKEKEREKAKKVEKASRSKQIRKTEKRRDGDGERREKIKSSNKKAKTIQIIDVDNIEMQEGGDDTQSDSSQENQYQGIKDFRKFNHQNPEEYNQQPQIQIKSKKQKLSNFQYQKLEPKSDTNLQQNHLKIQNNQSAIMNDEELNYQSKQHLVEEFSVRFWYVLPKWPPENYDYTPILKQNGLRRVDPKDWKREPEERDGLRKVIELESFTGYFKDSQGRNYDLRPKETCPSLNNFERMDRQRLQQLLLKAYEAQYQQLVHASENHTEYDKKYEQALTIKLKKKINKLSGVLGHKI